MTSLVASLFTDPDKLAAYITATGSAIVAVTCAVAAGYERFVNRKKAAKIEADQTTLAEALAYKQRGDMMLAQVEEYRGLLEREYKAHDETRKYHHEQATLGQTKLAECNERCMELQARTDISKVENILVQQTAVLNQLVIGMQKLLEKL